MGQPLLLIMPLHWLAFLYESLEPLLYGLCNEVLKHDSRVSSCFMRRNMSARASVPFEVAKCSTVRWEA